MLGMHTISYNSTLLTTPLVPLQPPHDLLHLAILVNSEALVLRYTRQLHVLAVQLLLHDLLQRLEHKHFRLGQRERLVEVV